MTVIDARQQQRYDTEANWATANPLLLAGEIGIESDTNRVKIGDGTQLWSDLDYLEAQIGSLDDLTDVNLTVVPTPQTGTPLIYSQGEWRTGPILGVADTNTDDFYNNVGLSLHFDGADGSTTYLDSGPANYNSAFITTLRTSALSSTEKRFGVSSVLLNSLGYTANSGILMTTTIASAWAFGSSPFTIEGWIYIDIASTDTAQRTLSLAQFCFNSISLGKANGSTLYNLTFSYQTTATRTYTTSAVIPGRQWVHIAVVRDTSDVRLYVDGVRLINTARTAETLTTGCTFCIGTRATSTSQSILSNNFIGYLDDFRITKGIARYTDASFTLPVVPNGNSLTTNPKIYYTLNSHSDVDLTNIPNDGQTLVWDASNSVFKAGDITTQKITNATPPASATSSGTPGEIRYDTNYVYVCTATNTWVRSSLATW